MWEFKNIRLKLVHSTQFSPLRASTGKMYMTTFIFQQDLWLIQCTEETLFNDQNIE